MAAEQPVMFESQSVAGSELPPVPPNLPADACTILLFYQYKEPLWTKKEHKAVLNGLMAVANKHGVTGRGRIAPEGANCTLTGTAEGVRAFCRGMREFNPLFNETDFKLTDNLPVSERRRRRR